MFDSHCHLNIDCFDLNINLVIDSARKNGVSFMLVPGFDIASSKKAVRIGNLYKNVFSAVGVQPTDDLEKLDIEGVLVKLEELLIDDKCLAVGEIGLDYYKYISPASVQKDFFRKQLKLALKMGKAAIVHNRLATQDVIKVTEEVVEKSKNFRIVFHCISPESEVLKFCIKNKIYMGVDGDVTYDDNKRNFVKLIPSELLLVETDSPYLTPKPIREIKRFPNEPANLKYVINKVAEIKNEDADKIASITSDNAKRCFGIGQSG